MHRLAPLCQKQTKNVQDGVGRRLNRRRHTHAHTCALGCGSTTRPRVRTWTRVHFRAPRGVRAEQEMVLKINPACATLTQGLLAPPHTAAVSQHPNMSGIIWIQAERKIQQIVVESRTTVTQPVPLRFGRGETKLS